MNAPRPTFAGNQLATRADAQQLARDLFAPLLPAFSEGRARVRFADAAANFSFAASDLEGFARPLWGIAPLVAGGGTFEHMDHILVGLANGSNPEHPEFWGDVGHLDQRAVEMAAIGYALAIAPEHFWHALPGVAKDRLGRWLGRVQQVAVHDDNWHFFVVMVQQGLERVGLKIDRSVQRFHLDRIDEFYLGDGWYGDGPEGFVDHYNSYALHTYGLLYARMTAETDRDRADSYIERARRFAASYRYWFGDDGASVGFGRSMTYRFGMASFWAALAVADAEALPWGEIRGLWGRHLRWWLSRPIADSEGRLTVGYVGAVGAIAEQYSSPNSPYWAMKALLPLSLPESHPFWQAAEADVLPDLPATIAVPAARFVAHRASGQAIILPAGPTVESVRNAPDKYAKFAYSSRFGFSVESERWLHMGYAGDNVLATSPDGRHWRTRETVLSSRIDGQTVFTSWQPWPGCKIETTQMLFGDWELRIHRIAAEQAFETIETGYALAGMAEENAGTTTAGALATSNGAESRLVDLLGRREAGVRPVMPNTNIMFPQAVVPALRGGIAAGDTILATAVHVRPSEAPACPPLPEGEMARAVWKTGFPWAGRQPRWAGTTPALVGV